MLTMYCKLLATSAPNILVPLSLPPARTPAMIAALFGRVDLLKTLQEKGVDLQVTSSPNFVSVEKWR